jgi:hypothetical protein
MHPRPQLDCSANIPMTQDEKQQRFVMQMIDTVLAQQDR